jgi:predicted Zn-dependent peptidase
MDNKVYREVLDNKMKLLFIPMKNVKTVSVGIFIKVGSRYETTENNGIAHFLEHLMFKGGCDDGGDEKLDELGADYNAFTDQEHTYYYVHGHKKDSETFINMIADIYTNPLFNDADIAEERNAIIAEMNYINNTGYTLNRLIYLILFAGCPLSMPVIGTAQNVLNFKYQDFINFRKEHYVPDKTVFVMAGNFDLNKMKQLVINKFKKVEPNRELLLMPIPCNFVQISPYAYLHKLYHERVDIALVFGTESLYSKNVSIYYLIENIITDNPNFKLHRTAKIPSNISYTMKSSSVSYMYEGLFAIQIQVNSEYVNTILDCVIKGIKDMKSEGITEEELIKARDSIIKQKKQKAKYATPYAVMEYCGHQELDYNTGNIPYSELDRTNYRDIIKAYELVTVKQINEVMRKMFTSGNTNIIVSGKYGKIECTNLKIINK